MEPDNPNTSDAAGTDSGQSGRLLRSRVDPIKKPPTSGEAVENGSNQSAEDKEMSVSTTASHYLGCRGLTSKRKIGDSLVTVHNTPKKPRAGACVTPKAVSNGAAPSCDLQDVYCWECHKECVENALDCTICPRTFHSQCLHSYKVDPPKETSDDCWICPVCVNISRAENGSTKSWALQRLNKEQFSIALNYALQRMKHQDSQAFQNPVPKSLLPDYYDVVFHPMDLSTFEENIQRHVYVSTEAFHEDVKWILHNSAVYNGLSSKYTTDAKLIIKICKHEMSEIELCPDCYLNSCLRKENWFSEPCTYPHCLVWAKLKGFPFWPAKALRVSTVNVDVRFFGAHDRAWLPQNQVYLLSEEPPLPVKNMKKFGYDKATEELQMHLQKIRAIPKIDFQYAAPKTEFKPDHLYNCKELFGTRMLDDRQRTTSAADDASFLADYVVTRSSSTDMLDSSRYRTESSASSTCNSDGTGNTVNDLVAPNTVNDLVAPCVQTDKLIAPPEPSVTPPQKSALSEKSPPEKIVAPLSSTKIILSKADDKTYNVRRPDSVPPGPSKTDSPKNVEQLEEIKTKINDETFNDATNENESQDLAEERTSDKSEEYLSVFDKMELLMNNPGDDELIPTEDADQLAKSVGRRAHAVKRKIGSSATSSRFKRKAARRAARRRNSRFRAIPTTAATTEPSSEAQDIPETLNSDQNGATERVNEIKQTTLQHLISRMSSATNSDSHQVAVVSSLAENPPNVASDNDKDKCTSRSSDVAASASPNAAAVTQPFETASEKLTTSRDTDAVKAVLLEKYTAKLSGFLSSILNNILDEVKHAAPPPSTCEHSDQPCTSKDVGKQMDEQAVNTGRNVSQAIWFYQEAVRSIKNTTQTQFAEIKQATENEKSAVKEMLYDMKRKLEEEKAQAIQETKQKQWCANCGKEAVFYCCWNTSYCDYPCQQLHWPRHQSTCAQIRQNGSANDVTINQVPNRSIQTATLPSFPPGATIQQLNLHQSVVGVGGAHASSTANVLPLYALPAAGYYKTATTMPTGGVLPTATMTLDLNSAAPASNGPQYLAIQPHPSHQFRQPSSSLAATLNRPPAYVATMNNMRK